MGSEIILYAYGIICVSMIIFNLTYNAILNSSDRRMDRADRHFSKAIEYQLNRIRNGEEVEEKYIKKLYRQLLYVNNLLVFDRAMDELLPVQSKEPAVQEYHRMLEPVFLRLALEYEHRENVQAAYFAYFLSKHRCRIQRGEDSIQTILVGYMRKDNLYCRINALAALYVFGSAENIVKAVKLQDRMRSFFHDKVLTDGLLSFTGDHRYLVQLLWASYRQFSTRTKLAVLNYIRYKSGDYKEEFFKIMMDAGADKELRLSAVRYFGKYQYEPAREQLMSFARDRNPNNWEYAAVSVSCLARYCGDDVVELLTEAVHSSNWYVRSNAADSLEAHGLDYSDLLRVVGGHDRYAREMMMYRLDARRIKNEKQETQEKPLKGAEAAKDIA